MEILRSLGATSAEAGELLAYNGAPFDTGILACPPALPLPDELPVAAWNQYAARVASAGTIRTLGAYLPQLCFPAIEGMSMLESYRMCTRRGADPRVYTQATGLDLQAPEQCYVAIHPTPAGRLPIVIATRREDFVELTRALTYRNEPVRIPPSMGAVMISGYNNWHRIRTLREEFFEANPDCGEAQWERRFQDIRKERELYQDRFMILSSGPYSGIGGAVFGYTRQEWQSCSMLIRCEHECAHYFTRRVLGRMRNCAFDELLADTYALVCVTGRFLASWFLRFMGLEFYPAYKSGGRLENYRGSPMLSERAFRVLRTLVHNAARRMEEFCGSRLPQLQTPRGRAALLFAIAAHTLEEAAEASAAASLAARFDEYCQCLKLEEQP